MLGECRCHEVECGVDESRWSDDEGGDGFVAAGDGADDGGVVGVVPDVALVGGDACVLETLTELVAERSTGAPEVLDGFDVAGRAVDGGDGLVIVCVVGQEPLRGRAEDRPQDDCADDPGGGAPT